MAKKNKRIEQSDICIGCGICVSICPVNTKLEKKDEFDPDDAQLAIKVYSGKAVLDEETCIACGACARICPVESLTIIEIPSE